MTTGCHRAGAFPARFPSPQLQGTPDMEPTDLLRLADDGCPHADDDDGPTVKPAPLCPTCKAVMLLLLNPLDFTPWAWFCANARCPNQADQPYN